MKNIANKIDEYLKNMNENKTVITTIERHIEYDHNHRIALRINSTVNNNTFYLFKIIINNETFKIFGVTYEIYYTNLFETKIGKIEKDEFLNKFDSEIVQLLIDVEVNIEE